MWHQSAIFEKKLTSILSNLNNFHSLEVVDRVSEAQLQVGENSNWIIWRLKGQRSALSDHTLSAIILNFITTDMACLSKQT